MLYFIYEKKFWLIRCVINGFGEVGIRFQNHHFNLFKKTLSAKEILNNDKYLLSKNSVTGIGNKKIIIQDIFMRAIVKTNKHATG